LSTRNSSASSIPAAIALDDEPSPWDSGISLCISICRAGSSLLYFSAMERAVVNTKFVSSDGSTDSAKSLKDTLKESESVASIYKNLLIRSEERRVGKESREMWRQYHCRRNNRTR